MASWRPDGLESQIAPRTAYLMIRARLDVIKNQMMKPKTVKTWLSSTHYSDSFCKGHPRPSWVPSNIRSPLPPIEHHHNVRVELEIGTAV